MQRAHDILTGTAGRLFPTTGFNFQGKGAVSPSEFIIAGDAIVATDRRWEWVSDYIGTPLECLPRDKQFLRAYDIPCMVLPKLVTRDVGEWTLCDAILDGGDQESSPTQGAQTANFADTDDCANNLYDSGTSNRPERRYDISITYDQYYETPRIWLIGFNACGLTLSQEEMLQDVPSVYAGKTITIGRHPYTGLTNMTVHPCYQMEAIYRRNNGKDSFRVENVILFAFEIWASVLPRFCLLTPKTVKGSSEQSGLDNQYTL